MKLKSLISHFKCLLVYSVLIRTHTMMHIKCRSGLYPRSLVQRFAVPDSKVSWSTEYKEYDPPSHTDPGIDGKPWADPEIGRSDFTPKWNNIDGKVNRKSYMGPYKIVNGYPLNPIGRTGLQGRGVLGRWGPNHAADPIVTRWKKIENGANHNDKSILQFVAIKRRDTGEWALPGGMVDPGEKVSATAIREFEEEAMNSLETSESEKEIWRIKFKEFFSTGIEIYSGYVDDPRNTDNAWMETTAYNYHDETGSVVGSLQLKAGDDAVGVKWVDITPELNLYASHKDMVNAVLALWCKKIFQCLKVFFADTHAAGLYRRLGRQLTTHAAGFGGKAV